MSLSSSSSFHYSPLHHFVITSIITPSSHLIILVVLLPLFHLTTSMPHRLLSPYHHSIIINKVIRPSMFNEQKLISCCKASLVLSLHLTNIIIEEPLCIAGRRSNQELCLKIINLPCIHFTSHPCYFTPERRRIKPACVNKIPSH